MSSETSLDYSAVVSATGFLRPRAPRSLETFHDHLITSQRTLAMLGAGLSASSGIPTYRGAGGVWRTHDVTQLATPAGFEREPALVWTFELERRKLITEAKPNAAHYALAAFAKEHAGFLALTMNLCHLHGSTFEVNCSKCDLRCIGEDAEKCLLVLLQHDLAVPLQRKDIPRCPAYRCDGLLRPGIVWFTESISPAIMKYVHDWIAPDDSSSTIDTMLVIGTSALVYPATAYVEAARRKGARVAVVDIEKEDPSLLGLQEQDWYFPGDAADLVPRMLAPAV
ncbi:putative SIR2 family histone deacetylase [Paraphoma chrysanthemicola]|nr:putative SIR2 family histone deacetylase [Paraphoma chrysanthemicola]